MNFIKLCLLTHIQQTSLEEYQRFIIQAIEGGVTAIQLREKNKTPSELLELGLGLKSILTPLSIPLIVNDHVDLAKKIDADGIHLGQSDVSPLDARYQLGPKKIIGLSIETMENLEEANSLSCIDYVAASAVFPSTTKKDCKTIWGLEGLKKLKSYSKHPIIAIGGIDKTNAKQVMEHGASGIAVIGAIHQSSHPKQAAAQLIQAMGE